MPKAPFTTVIAILVLLIAGAPLLAQCPLCRTAAGAASEEVAASLNTAILVLLAPAMMLFCGVYAFAFRGRKRVETHHEEVDDW